MLRVRVGLTAIFLLILAMGCQSPIHPSQPKDTGVSGSTVLTARALTGTVGAGHPASGAFSPVSESTWASGTWALGASFTAGEGSTLRVAVYSANATKVVLELYAAATGQAASYDYDLKKGSDNVWRGQIAQVPGKTFYAFRAWGPNWPFSASWTRGNSAAGFVTDVDAAGNRFNPNKVLYDPYARELSHDRETPAMVAAGENGGMFGTGGTDVAAGQTYSGPLTGNVAINRRNVDTAKWAPKAIALADTTSFGTKPALPASDAIVYEAHVRGLTQHPSVANLQTLLAGVPGFEAVANVPDAYRGTYKGAGLMAKYLKALGYTTIELLPVHETANDANGASSPAGNFWGYMTYGYFAPDRRYAYDKAPGGPTAEFKQMVAAFHAEGIEVWLDVVYNHTGEGGNWDATKKVAEVTSFRGLDNASYYALVAGDKASYWETTGCGNNFDASQTPVKNLVKDSLAYWAGTMGVDGFRFDLAPVLGRDAAPTYNFNSGASLLSEIAAYGASSNTEMVAEAWDIGTYQVGNFPSGWGEWNGRYRDTIRKFMKGDASGSGISWSDAFYGDYGFFNDQGGPDRTVNFIAAHDGFTLADIVSYNTKNNTAHAWPFGPSDGGSDSNDSSDWGGDKGLRRQVIRNFIAFQALSRGIPMHVYGDEFGRTQNGNNNPYNVDSVATWNNYNFIGSDTPQAVATGDATGGTEAYHNNLGTDANANGKNDLFLFTKAMLNLRKDHKALRQGDYSVPITFTKLDGSAGFGGYSDLMGRVYIQGTVVGDNDFLVLVNMYSSAGTFTIPAAPAGTSWIRVADTAAWAESSSNAWTAATGAAISGTYGVNPRSMVVLMAVGAAASSNANLSALSVSAGPLSPSFAAATTAYTASVANGVTTSTVTATKADAGATLQYQVNAGTWTALTSGTSSASFALNVGANTVNVKVTAANGTVKTYTATVTRASAGAPNGQLTIVLKTGGNSESIKFPGDFNGWNINTTQALSSTANTTKSLVVSGAVVTSALTQGNSTSALELQVINAGGSWANAWGFGSWTKVGCTVPDGKQITIAATDQDVVTLTIDVATTTLTATVEAR